MDVARSIEIILEQQANIAVIHARHEEEIVRLDTRLRRAVRLAVQEARAERRRRRELDARFELKMDQLASAHLLTEESLKQAGERIDKLGEKVDKLSDKIDRIVDFGWRGGNGHPQ